MRLVIVRPMLLLCAILLLPAFVFAQEAVLTGTITDATGAVLPGVTVQATHESSGNTFEAVTDGRGVYRIPARIGTYKITAQLTGFGVATRQGVELLVGQTLTLNLQMSPSTLQETVTVTGEAPLISTQSSSIGGTIDPRDQTISKKGGWTMVTGTSEQAVTTLEVTKEEEIGAPGATGCRWRCSRRATGRTRRARRPCRIAAMSASST